MVAEGEIYSLLPEQPSLFLVFSWVRVAQSLVSMMYFVDHCLSCCPFSFGSCVLSLDLRFLITPLVSSNFSHKTTRKYTLISINT